MERFDYVRMAANIREYNEERPFKDALKPANTPEEEIDRLYRLYLKEGRTSPWVNHYCRQITKDFDRSYHDCFVYCIDWYLLGIRRSLHSLA